MLAFLVGDPLLAGQWRRAGTRALVIVAVVGALQVPWAIHWMRKPGGTAGTPVGDSLLQIASGGALLRLGFSAGTFVNGVDEIQARPWQRPAIGWVVAIAAIVALARWRHDRALLAVSVMPLACVWIGFAVWQGGVHSYYYFSLMPAVVLTVGLALTASRPGRAASVPALAMLAVAIVIQPARLEHAAGIHRMHEYGALLRASRSIARRHQAMRRIEAAFVPSTSDPHFLYQILGGRLDPNADWIATVTADGQVKYELAARLPGIATPRMP